MNFLEKRRPLILSLIIAAVFKIWLVFSNSTTFNGDEAVIATMARHILQGAKPVFFYGQEYMGSLDAYLVAGGFAIFGEHVWVIRLVQSVLYLLYIVTLWWLAKLWFKDSLKPAIVVILAAIPPIVVTTYTTMSLGGYGESLLLGNLILSLGYLVIYGDKQFNSKTWIILGLVGGLAFWTLGMAGIYLLPIGLLGLWKFDRKKIKYYLFAAGSFLIGSLPWWFYNLENEWGAFSTLTGVHIYSSSIFERIQSAILFGIPALLGMRFPWGSEYLPWPLIFVILILNMGVILFIANRCRKRGVKDLSNGVTILLIYTLSCFMILFLSTYGIDFTGRYLLPLYLPLLFAMASLISYLFQKKFIFGWMVIILILGTNLIGSILAANSVDKFTTQFDPISSFDNSSDQALIKFLTEKGELRGYSNYWVTFRFAFLTNEEIIFAADLPYKQDLSFNPLGNRYPRYSEIVDASEKVAFITTDQPNLNELIRNKFESLKISFLETDIGEFHIFYDLSEAVRPEDIGFSQ
ncbi:MAG: hypothetical protein HON98_11440 [Chloroflexi bacterium]|jgi:4-amino-4-deoxy-L-arabinose transferase-like glycosyltransferase|nr:hypothetical protein [Chloroflexota bacterium]MBT3670791.1 hypothetical protein [Chloroflexota bacterium]MBT4002084.1 hypothetical protein [Chloroflexota bacterium]MBT4305600.1 hypothetical protein [Chloroflexota bacterium]MBT4533319.1 hypothetical protein [Chloroflexota bacterium]